MVLKLFTRTVEFLRDRDKTFPYLTIHPDEINIRDECLGDGYAWFTDKAMEAVKMMEDIEGIHLDGTYTGKVFAALISDARCGELKDKNVLFWNTLNAYDLSPLISTVNYRDLPKPLHYYFEQDVQPLDINFSAPVHM